EPATSGGAHGRTAWQARSAHGAHANPTGNAQPSSIALDRARACSSVGQSTSLTPRGSPVRVGPRPSSRPQASRQLPPAQSEMTDDSPIRIAVIGSGPAGFYAAGHLLKDSAGRIEVDMIERLPTPWGLVRSAVAPDHPKIKSVSRVYEKTGAPALSLLRQRVLRRGRIPRGPADPLPR